MSNPQPQRPPPGHPSQSPAPLKLDKFTNFFALLDEATRQRAVLCEAHQLMRDVQTAAAKMQDEGLADCALTGIVFGDIYARNLEGGGPTDKQTSEQSEQIARLRGALEGIENLPVDDYGFRSIPPGGLDAARAALGGEQPNASAASRGPGVRG